MSRSNQQLEINLSQKQIDEIQKQYNHLRFGIEVGFTHEYAKQYLVTTTEHYLEEIEYALIGNEKRVTKFDIQCR